MWTSRQRAVTFLLFLVFAVEASGCSGLAAGQRLDNFTEHMRENSAAWWAARQRLSAMCGPSPAAPNCALRLVKRTNSQRTDDWFMEYFPPYKTIVDVHEEELRRVHAPYPYEEYMLGVARLTALKADARQISPDRMKAAVNEAWNWMSGEVRKEAALLVYGVRDGRAADAQVWQSVATGLGVVLTGILLVGVAATAMAPVSPAVICDATPTVYGVRVYCQ